MIEVGVIREYPDYENEFASFFTLKEAQKWLKEQRKWFENEGYKITCDNENYDFTATDATSKFCYYINI